MLTIMKVGGHDLYFPQTLPPDNLGTMPVHLPLSNAGRTQYVEVGMTPTYGMVPLVSSSRLPFRQTLLDYPRPGTYGGQCADYPEDITYGSMAYPPPPMHNDQLDIGYGSGNIPPPRSFTPGPPLVHKHQNVSCYEPLGPYPEQGQQAQTQHQLSQYGGPGQSFALPLRSSISSADSHNPYSLQSMAQTLPNPSERALPTLPAPLPTSRLTQRYDLAMVFTGNTVPSNAPATSLVPSQPQMKPLTTSSQLANHGNYMGISTSPDGTITSNSSFSSADTGSSSQNDMYASPGEWSQDGLPDASTAHSSIPQQQHQLASQTQSQMTSMSLNTRRSQNDLQNEIDNYHHNTAAHNSNNNHPYSLNNGSVNSLHTGSAVNLSSSHNLGSNVQVTDSGQSTPLASVSQHPQARKLSHHHSAHFQPVPSSGDSSLSSLPSSSGMAGNIATTGYSNASLSVNSHDGRSLGASLLSNGQAYEPWDGSPPQAQQQTMNMSRMLGDHRQELSHRESVQGLGGIRV